MKIWGIALILWSWSGVVQVHAAPPKAMHWAADHSFMNRKTNIVNLRGNAYVSRDDEEMHGDEIDINLSTNEVEARGRITYQYGEIYIRADAMEFNLDTNTGVVHNGNLSNGRLALRGEQMDLLSKDHLLIKDYQYTTCVDCPNSWTVAGSNADVTFEGYAFIKNFIFKIKDASLFWFPYMIFPLKSKRQSGFLFPRFGTIDTHGFYFVQPYFWATGESTDMTLGAGTYAKQGKRGEWEGRYALTNRSKGEANLFWTQDDSLRPKQTARAAAKVYITQELPLGFEGKLRYLDVSDSGYPIEFNEDIPGRFEPVLTSDLFFSRNDPNLSTTISLKRIRNLLYFDPSNPRGYTAGFDAHTVQEVPRIVVNSNNQFLFHSNVSAGVEARFNHFTRSTGPIDSGVLSDGKPFQTIREANRLTLSPNMYTTINPVPWLSVVPSIQYRSYFYSFNNVDSTLNGAATRYDDLARGYLLAQSEMSFQLEKVSQGDEGRSYKSTIRPTLKYSVIPTIQEPLNHPFIDQVQSKARPGQYFDNSDIVPLGTSQNLENYFTPLGHSLTYGVVSNLFRKQAPTVVAGDLPPSSLANLNVATQNRILEIGVQQTLDIRESSRGGIPFSPVFSHLLYEDQGITWYTEYTYYVDLERYKEALISGHSPHRLSTSLSWAFEKETRNGVLNFERSIGINYTYSKLTSKVSALSANLVFSINDYLMPFGSVSYDLISTKDKLLSSKGGLIYQSPSQCWRLDASLSRSVDLGTSFALTFGLNLSGNGLNGVSSPM